MKQVMMKRKLDVLILFVFLLAISHDSYAYERRKQKTHTPILFAHRGCWSQNKHKEFIIPENSLPAVAMAKQMGYTGIECDVRYTKDSVMVILHDGTLNRTVRRASDYSRLTKPVRLSNLTFEELRRDYVLESTNPEWRTPIPTLEELLSECKKHGIVPMLHSALIPSYHVAQQMFGNEWICFSEGVEHMQRVREFSDCTILLAVNNGSAEENITRLEQIGGSCGISTMNHSLYTPEFCKALTDRGYIVQASIFPAPYEAIGQRNGITYQLTDFSIMPNYKPIGKGRGKLMAKTQDTTWNWNYNKILNNCGLTLDIEFKGEVEIIMNNERTYILTRKKFGKDKIGGRFFSQIPCIKVIAKQGTQVKKVIAKVYAF